MYTVLLIANHWTNSFEYAFWLHFVLPVNEFMPYAYVLYTTKFSLYYLYNRDNIYVVFILLLITLLHWMELNHINHIPANNLYFSLCKFI